MGEHDKALELIIYKLNDYDGAFDYCLNNSINSKQLQKKLFLKLLSIYAAGRLYNKSFDLT